MLLRQHRSRHQEIEMGRLSQTHERARESATRSLQGDRGRPARRERAARTARPKWITDKILAPCGARSGRDARGPSEGIEWLRRRLVKVKSFITAIVVVSLLVGSVAAQKKYQPPAVKTPDTFRGVDTAVPIDQNSIGDLKWFEVFKDEELQKLLKTAFVQNYDLRAAVARINAERANLGLARSNQFPQIEASADITTTRTSKNGALGIAGQGGRTRSVGSVLLNLLTFELDVWGRLRQQTKAARAELRASQEDRKAVLTTVVADVATGYFSLLELDGELEIGKRTLATRQDSLRLIRARHQGGLATLLDVRQAEELVYQ